MQLLNIIPLSVHMSLEEVADACLLVNAQLSSLLAHDTWLHNMNVMGCERLLDVLAHHVQIQCQNLCCGSHGCDRS